MKTKKLIKKLKLRREIVFILGAVTVLLLSNVITYSIDRYNDYLIQCDSQRGYTCNIFGK